MRGIPILMYHALEHQSCPAGARDPGEKLYVLQVAQFREQMRYLHGMGFKTVLLKDLPLADDAPENTVVITFDDGHESNHALALPILLEYGFKAEFFITTGWIGAPHYLSPSQIEEIHRAGMGIGSHGATHAYLSELPSHALDEELSTSRAALEAITRRPIDALSAPGGRIARRVRRAALAKGYRMLCTSRPGVLDGARSYTDMPRFAVRATDDVTRLARIVAKERWHINRLRVKAAVLGCTKRILRTRRYERVRGLFMRDAVAHGRHG